MHRRIPPSGRRAGAPLAVLALCLVSLAEAAPERRSFGDHLYSIAVRLDPVNHEVSGTVRIRYTNRSHAALDALVFHLYPNAFEHGETVFMRESEGALRGVPAAGRGRIVLLSLTLDGASALERAETELVPKDRTQLRVPLEAALAPGERVEVEIAFVTYLPALFARSGYAGTFHVVSQFFPKLAKLTPSGEWRSFPYHGLGEFFADFADYELAVTAPPGFRIVSGGVRGQVDSGGPWPVHRFRAESVHDVAFVAWDRFQTRHETCHGVRVHLHHPEGGDAAAARSLALACAAFGELGRELGPYPYKDLSIVFPPRGAEGGAGMEYPGLILSAAGTLHPARLHMIGPDTTTAHELAHQWFQGIVATDEVRHPMLDEGLSTYVGNELLARVFGRATSGSECPPLDVFELSRTLLPERVLPPSRPVYAFPREGELYASVYGHFPLSLETFARIYGRDRLMRALGHFAREHRFGHPGPDDLLRSFRAVYSGWFVDALARPALFEGRTARFSLHGGARGGTLRLVAKRGGALPLPTTVAVTYVDGSIERIPFPPDRDELVVERDERDVARVEIDPDHHVMLDGDRTDQRYLARRRRPQVSLLMAVRALFSGLFG